MAVPFLTDEEATGLRDLLWLEENLYSFPYYDMVATTQEGSYLNLRSSKDVDTDQNILMKI
ncbi:MAG: hypothetical protein AAFQ68_24905, partial [Bacteroidota bacterium]